MLKKVGKKFNNWVGENHSNAGLYLIIGIGAIGIIITMLSILTA